MVQTKKIKLCTRKEGKVFFTNQNLFTGIYRRKPKKMLRCTYYSRLYQL